MQISALVNSIYCYLVLISALLENPQGIPREPPEDPPEDPPEGSPWRIPRRMPLRIPLRIPRGIPQRDPQEVPPGGSPQGGNLQIYVFFKGPETMLDRSGLKKYSNPSWFKQNLMAGSRVTAISWYGT